MTKRTVKVGIVGKYGTRYGASLRRIIKKFEVQQHSRYVCSFCGKVITSSHYFPLTFLRNPSKESVLVSGTVKLVVKPLLVEHGN